MGSVKKILSNKYNLILLEYQLCTYLSNLEQYLAMVHLLQFDCWHF